MFKTFLSCCCMREIKDKKKIKYKKTGVAIEEEEDIATFKPLTSKAPSPEELTFKEPTSKASTPKEPTLKTSIPLSEIVFASSSPIFTLHRATLPSVSTSSEDFCFFQDIYLLSQEESLNEISNYSNKSLNPLHGNITFIDQSPYDHQTIIDNINTAKTLPRLSRNGRVFRKMFASPEDSKFSGSSFRQASDNSFNSLELRRNQFRLRNTSNTSTESDSFNRKSPKKEKYLFAKGIKRSKAFDTAELLQKRLNVDEDEEDDEDVDRTSNTSSIERSEPSIQVASQISSEDGEVISQPLRKIKAFHDKELLDQQVKEDEMYQIEMRRKIVEEYVQHVYEIKLKHQVELDKVEDIYKQKLLDTRQYRDTDVDDVVGSVRTEADAALANFRRGINIKKEKSVQERKQL